MILMQLTCQLKTNDENAMSPGKGCLLLSCSFLRRTITAFRYFEKPVPVRTPEHLL